jgi:hypothetical protein
MPRVFFCTPAEAHLDVQVPVIAIKVGEPGYYALERIHADPAELNPEGTTPEVIESAIAGSMFGWDVPAAQLAIEFANALARQQPRRVV